MQVLSADARSERVARLSRLDFLRVTTLAATGLFASAAWPSRIGFAQTADERSARIARLIEEYDQQGVHRTGTDTDNRSSTWLAELARQAGADVSLETFTLSRVDVKRCILRVGTRQIDGLPMFDGTFTGSDGISGRLGPPGSDADIVLSSLDAAGISAEGGPLAQLRRAGRYRGVVIVTRGPHSGLSPANASAFTSPFGPPALQVSSEDGAWLESLGADRATIQLIVHADRTPSEAFNVVGEVAGSDTSLPPLVVMTPRSGWWQCAAERGGGLACWLEAIRAVRAARARRTVQFVASSGHELGHLGLDSFLARRSDLIARAAAWIHLGANIGAAGGRMRVQASDDAIELEMLNAVKGAGIGPPNRVARGTVPAGEARNIHIAGGRYVSILGSSPVFHNPADRWPAAVDLQQVTRFSTAMADLAVRLAAMSGPLPAR